MSSVNAVSHVREPVRSTPVRTSVDVLVVGAGPAGIMAALAAARGGARTALVDGRSFVGGNLTIGLPILGFLSRKGSPIVAGLPQTFIDRLRAQGAAGEHQPCPLHVSITLVDPEAVKSVAMEMLLESGAEVMLYTTCVGAVMDGQRVRGIITESKVGREAILAKVVIDCTGDGDVAFRAGVPCGKGDEQGGMQPPTLMFRMSDVDTEKLRRALSGDPVAYSADIIPADYFGKHARFIVVGLRGLMQKARAAGLSIATERTILITGLRDGEVWVNMTRVKGVDGTDPRSLCAGEIEARRQIEGIRQYLVGYVPGFEKSTLTQTAPFLGLRETRRIVGQYVLNRDDILTCRTFEDAVAVGSYPIDLHRPHDNDCTLEYCDDCYDIPYRSLLPSGVDGLLVAGRCISTTHEAMAAIRVMSTCMAMGEAAGVAAALAVSRAVEPSAVDVRELRAKLVENGAYLRGE